MQGLRRRASAVPHASHSAKAWSTLPAGKSQKRLTLSSLEGAGCGNRHSKDLAAMCSCQQHSTTSSATTPVPSGAISFRVEDMTCGHCAGTIKQAIEGKIPGVFVTADPASKLVSVEGSADAAAISSAIAAAGYTPSAEPVG
jgi:copper chaperone